MSRHGPPGAPSSQYVRGTLIVATFHGVVVASTLAILGVPLAFPLGVLVGLGSFVPLVGAFLTGVLAVAVAGLSKGLLAAIIVVAVLLLDNQIEAHVLQPFVVGRYVRIHPLALVLALASGAVLFGIFGAIVAVPVVACINSAIRAVLDSRDQPSEGDLDSNHGLMTETPPGRSLAAWPGMTSSAKWPRTCGRWPDPSPRTFGTPSTSRA